MATLDKPSLFNHFENFVKEVHKFTFKKDKKIEALEKELQEKKEEVKELRLLLNRNSEWMARITTPTAEFASLKSSDDEGEYLYFDIHNEVEVKVNDFGMQLLHAREKEVAKKWGKGIPAIPQKLKVDWSKWQLRLLIEFFYKNFEMEERLPIETRIRIKRTNLTKINPAE